MIGAAKPRYFSEDDDSRDMETDDPDFYAGPFDDAGGGDDLVILPRDRADFARSRLTARFTGGASDDEILFGTGLAVHGGEGGDWLTGGTGRDHLYGDAGPDYLDGGPDDAADYLFGGADDDWFIDLYSRDQAFGEAGDDHFIVLQPNSLTAMRIDGGKGFHTVYVPAAPEENDLEITKDMAGQPITMVRVPGVAGSIELRSVEKLVAAQRVA